MVACATPSGNRVSCVVGGAFGGASRRGRGAVDARVVARGSFWDENPTCVLLTTMMVSADVSPLQGGFVGALLLNVILNGKR